MGSPKKLPIFDSCVWRVGRVVRQEPAKLRTGVRFPHAPPVICLDELGASPKILLSNVSKSVNYLNKVQMIKFRTLKLSAHALFLATVLGACASSGDSPSGSPQEVQEVQAQLLGDMLLPQGSRLNGSESIIIGRGNEWVGRATVNALQGATDVYAFFQSEYPKNGWTTVTAVKAKTSILVFTKGDRTATIEVVDGSLGGPKSVIVITSSPKSANVQAPVRK